MKYLIDGSNLLGYMRQLETPYADISLLAMVDRFCIKKRHNALVIFDALHGREFGSRFGFGDRITVKVAPPGNQPDRADRVILAALNDFDSHEEIRVVTDDTDLIFAVRSRGFSAIRCSAFMHTVGTMTSAEEQRDEKELAAHGIDNEEFLRMWSGGETDKNARYIS